MRMMVGGDFIFKRPKGLSGAGIRRILRGAVWGLGGYLWGFHILFHKVCSFTWGFHMVLM